MAHIFRSRRLSEPRLAFGMLGDPAVIGTQSNSALLVFLMESSRLRMHRTMLKWPPLPSYLSRSLSDLLDRCRRTRFISAGPWQPLRSERAAQELDPGAKGRQDEGDNLGRGPATASDEEGRPVDCHSEEEAWPPSWSARKTTSFHVRRPAQLSSSTSQSTWHSSAEECRLLRHWSIGWRICGMNNFSP